MSMKKPLADWKIATKIMAIALGTNLVILAVVLVYLLPSVEERILDAKRADLRNLVDAAYSELERRYAASSSGQMTEEDAKREATSTIRSMRYNGSDYFWINDLDARMLMHPVKPELDGKDLSDMKDPDGKFIFREFTKVARAEGGGFVDYLWPKPGSTEPAPKISCVRLFKPWGWIVGTGLYIDDVEASVASFQIKVFLVFLCAIGLSIAGAIWMSRRIVRPIHEMVDITARVARGELPARCSVGAGDEVGIMAAGFEEMIGRLREIVRSISGMSRELSGHASEMAQATASAAGRIDQQFGQVEQSAAASTEISQTVVDVAQNAAAAAEAAQAATGAARDGKIVVEKTAAAIGEIAGMVETSASTIEALGESSRQIGEISRVITDIADQTNLLALNAAIEAARAGEQGRGFAVVADEVRKLAERTAKATGEISDMIKKIRTDTESSVTTMARGKLLVEEGLRMADSARDALDKIVAASEECSGVVHSIAVAAEEQSAAVEQISRGMEEISHAAQSSRGELTRITSGTEDLAKLSSSLENEVAWFRMEEGRETGQAFARSAAAPARRMFPS